MFHVDPAWPLIPNNWVLGEVTSGYCTGRQGERG
jgi:hypothetical protein